MSNKLFSYVRRDKPDNPRMYAIQLFGVNDISPVPDSELTDLIATSSQYMKDGDLTKLLCALKKFDGPVTMMETDQKVEHWGLRNSLKQLPAYMEAAESAGLAYKQANGLLLHILHSEPYDFHQEDITISLMTRVYRRAAAAGVSIPDSYKFVKKMIKLGAKSGVIDGCFYAFSILMRLGLSVDQACKTVMRIPEAEGSASGYPFPYFCGAIKSMLPAKVNPDLVVEAFEYLGGERPWFNMSDYTGFKALMTFGCPSQGITPNELLAMFVTKARNGNKDTSLLEAVSSELNSDGEKPIALVSENRYFTETSGALEHFAQPYKNKRTLSQGVRDLEKLAVACEFKWEEVGEGMWIFDPEKQIWYSLGGELELPSMGQVLSRTADRVRHNFLAYDISELSSTPFLFHVHPGALESFIAPPRDSMSYPQFRDDITKFLTATPRRADYGVVAEFLKISKRQVPTRSFIVHALGTTEFTYPHRIVKLEEMKETSRDIRDQVMLRFNVNNYLSRNDVSHNKFDLVQRLIHDLEEMLPESFNVILHPVGTDKFF
ncbi:MAG: hypothetical protein HY363_02815 [Candidatus Aenigmarchaeota archaeon]|nr:hypothetical protein [Candidatus Aenigmarchaeota archaeon]